MKLLSLLNNTRVIGNDLLVHFLPAVGLHAARKNELAFKQGGNIPGYYLYLLIQSSEAAASCSLAASLCGRNISYLSNPLFLFSLSPLLFQLVESEVIPKGEFGQRLVSCLRPIHDKIGTISQVAFIVSELAIFILTKNRFALAGALFGVYGFADRLVVSGWKLIPSGFSSSVDRITSYLHPVTLAIGSASIFGHVVGLISLLDSFIKRFFLEEMIPYSSMSCSSILTLDQMNQLVEKGDQWEKSLGIDKRHLKISPFPEAKRLAKGDDYQDAILPLLEELVKDESRLRVLEDRVKRSPEWEVVDGFSTPLEFVKNRLKTLTQEIINESIATGAPRDYRCIQTYLGYIEEHILEYSPEHQLDLCLKLALSAGDYCGIGRHVHLADVAFEMVLTDTSEGVDLKRRVLSLLQADRRILFEQFHQWVWRFNPSFDSLVGKVNDPHSLILTASLYGNRFGLPGLGDVDDEAYSTSGIAQLIGSKIADLIFLRSMKKSSNPVTLAHSYTPPLISLEVAEAAKSGLFFGEEDVQKWARNWYEKATQNLQICADFDDWYIEHSHLVIPLMLIDFGVLRLVS